jgi:soluble lytic murein transglycosylase-like protein
MMHGWRIVAAWAGIVITIFCIGLVSGVAMVRGDEGSTKVPRPAEGRLAPQPYVLPLEYAQIVIRFCDETGVPVWLACRLFYWESGWRPGIIGRENDNGTRDYGLAQLNSAYLESFSIYNDGKTVDPFNPEHAIRVGIRYLAALYAEHGTWREAVRKYAGNRPAQHTRQIMGEAR